MGGVVAVKLIVQNEDQHFKFELSEESIILGRSKSCDIQIKDSLVSGKHCIVTLVNGKASVSDIGTTNGTFLNESPIEFAGFILKMSSQLETLR